MHRDPRRTPACGDGAVLDFAEVWGGRSWPFLAFDAEIRKIVCTTDGRVGELPSPACGEGPQALPNEQASLKCVCLAIMSLDPTGQGPERWSMRWKPALNAFDGRLPDGRG